MEPTNSNTDPFAGTTLEGADTSALDEMSADCCGADNRLYLVKPIYPMPDGKARAGSGVAHAGCCAGGVTRDAYLHWMPMLNGAIGFITLDVTDDAP
jgi:hypothetical protein